MKYEYTPKGVCSRKMIFDIEDGKVMDLQVIGGCHGNLQGVGALIKGMTVEEVIERLDGIICGSKQTSCPGQIAQGLKAYLAEV
ncbi:MAG: TIGR03905 family TSCPD domain-containing protein [Eubacterium sp.]|nr:TIGR03905 family TSCPD domain-containing protein [Eubacterium sp.]